jgi:uncharacterized protein YbjT (DUF2867 family)/glyoxylase-like metal-dependent hydrolase (beta-lactamase superfamily II)
MILVTGATGYVGGRLVAALESRGLPVRAMARHPEHLRERVAATTEVVRGDVLDASSLSAALRGVDVAFYLVHSMGSADAFEQADRTGAENFGAAARAAGVRRIVYLGGLAADRPDLSPHLRSRHEVGRLLRASGVPVIELRASIIIGSGSLSFEMVRALVERLPVMITPSWVAVKAQPIAIGDLLAYLLAARDLPMSGSRVFEIGGADRVSYGDVMTEYARQRGLRRLMLPVPVLTPRLSSLWLGLVTPIYARVGRKLIDSMRHETVVRDDAALEIFDIRPRGIHDAIASALRNDDMEFAATRWSDALSAAGPAANWQGTRFGSRLVDSRAPSVPVSPTIAFLPIQRIGGDNGWYFADWLWDARGFLDLLVGGVGQRRGRRHPKRLRIGDAVDWWRVEAFEPGRRLRLVAEMKLPGRAWLEFDVTPDGEGSVIRQTATFDPVGLWGLAYWYLVYPLHQLVFRGMLRAIVARAREEARAAAPAPALRMPGVFLVLVMSLGLLAHGAWARRDHGFPPDQAPHHVRTTTPSGIGLAAVRTGWVQVKEPHWRYVPPAFLMVPRVFLSRRWHEWIPNLSYVVTTRSRVLLVDTGADPAIVAPGYMDCDRSARLFYRSNMRFVAPPARTIDRQLRELSIAPERVDTVVITHFHADHPGRLSAFPRARVLTGAGNWPSHLGAVPCTLPPGFAPEAAGMGDGPFGVFSESQRLLDDADVRLVPLPGHTPGHVGVLVRDAARYWLIAGDATFDEQETAGLHVCGVSQDPTVARETQRLVRRQVAEYDTVLLPAHDRTVFARLTER